MEKAKKFHMKFIEPGLCFYQDEGMILIQKDALDRMADSFVGMPVFNEDHISGVPYEELIECYKAGRFPADGTVAAVFWNEETGWYEGDLIVWDDDAAANIESGKYFPSCAYLPGDDPEDMGPPGTWHNIEYDAEIINGKYTHLAIVPTPRYEGARFENSVGGNTMVFKLLKKKEKQNAGAPPAPPEEKPNEAPPAPPAPASPAKQDEGMENGVDMGALVELPSGEQVSLADLIANYKAKTQGEAQNGVSPDDMVEIEPGVEVSVADLIAAYVEKANAVDPQDEPAQLPMTEKQNSTAKANMAKVRRAVKAPAEMEMPFETEDDRLARGRERYSLKKKEA